MRSHLVPLAALALCSVSDAQRARSPKPLVAPATTQLPVTRVSLYKNGVGFFEHSGRVTGNQAVTIDFTTAQLDDVLQTLTAIDLGGGRISGAGYNSTTPLDQQLKSLALGLGPKTTFSGLFTALRGTRVEIHGTGAPFTGRLVDIEMHKTGAGKDQAGMTEGRFLTVAAESGAIRIFEMTPSLEVRLLDTSTHTDLTRYLELLDSSRNQGLRHLTLDDRGTGSRELRVSYLSEVPIWKSTYRILFTDAKTPSGVQTATLQGWSVVDNTTGADWNNVQLSLIAGAPQSFIQPLSQPIYSRRPEIPIAQEAQLTPQTHESGEEDKKAPPPPKPRYSPGLAGMAAQTVTVDGLSDDVQPLPTNGRSMAGLAAMAPGIAMGKGAGLGGGVYSYQEAAAASTTPAAQGTAFDDFFEYKLTDPITIRKNESALVPILQTKIDAERVTLWSPADPVALRALWITNTSTLTLDRGSFSLVEDGNFAGEGLLDAIHPGEKRLLSYAADQAVRVTGGHFSNTSQITHLAVNKGVLVESVTDISRLTYQVHNAAPEPRTVILEHPIRAGWTLDSPNSPDSHAAPVPAETTPTAYRYRILTQPGETVPVHIRERHPQVNTYRLANTADTQLTLILKNANASPALLAQLEPVFAAKRALSDLDKQLASKQNQLNAITEDQKRLRDNLSALKGSAEERTLAKRYTEELNQQEDQLATLHHDLDQLHQQHDTAQQNLEAQIEAVKFED